MSRTFRKILILLIAVSGAATILSNLVLYVRFEQTGLAVARENNIQDLQRISNSIAFTLGIAENFLLNQFLEPQNRVLMMSQGENEYTFFETQEIVVRMKQSVRDSAIVQSLFLYNAATDRLFSTNATTLNPDQDLLDLFAAMEASSLNRPLPRVLNADSYLSPMPVFTFIIGESDQNGAPWLAAAVNIPRDVVFQNLGERIDRGSFLRIYDGDFNLLGSEASEDLDPSILVRLRGSRAASDSFIAESNDGRSVVTFARMAEPDWIIVKEENYNAVFSYMETLKMQSLGVLFLFLTVAIALSSIASRLIYRPIGRIVGEAKAFFDPEGSRPSDDAAFISNLIKVSVERIRYLESYKETADSFFRRNLLRAILLDTADADEESAGMAIVDSLYTRTSRVLPAVVDARRPTKSPGTSGPADPAQPLSASPDSIARIIPPEVLLDAVEVSKGLFLLALDSTDEQRALESLSRGLASFISVRRGETTNDAISFVRESKRLLGDPRWNSSATASVLLLSVAEFIEKNHADPNLCLKGLGSAFKMSPEYLGKIFRKTYGLSVADRITEIRLARAAELISGTERNAGEILYSVGFDNESYFYRAFKRKYDMTPREYRLLSITGTAQAEKSPQTMIN